MMKVTTAVVVILGVMQSVEAWQGVVKARRGMALRMGIEDMAGGGAPFGIFDPVGFANDVTDLDLKKFQEAELKHGRICMLATIGIPLQEVFHPLFGGNIDGPAIFHFQKIQANLPIFWLVVTLAIGAVESITILRGWEPFPPKEKVAELREDYVVGDLGFDPLGFTPSSPEEFKTIRTKELNNGRLAMIATIGMLGQELVTNKGIIESLTA